MKTRLFCIPPFGLGIPFVVRILLILSPLSAWVVPSLLGQTSTTVNLSTQGKNPDFSAMSVTRPVTVGSSLPSTCIVGQLYFNSGAAAGSNISACTSANTWTLVGASLNLPLSVGSGGTGTTSPGLVAGSNVTITGSWPNQTIAASGTGGSSGNATTIQGASVSSTTPSNNQALIYNGSSSAYIPTSIYTLQNGLGTTTSGSTNLQVNVSYGVRAVTSTTDTVVSTDCGGLITYTNSAAVTVALPQAGTGGNFTAGCPVTVHNYGSAAVTFTLSSGTVGGASTLAVNQSKGCLLVSDGTNWQLGNCN